MRRLISIGQLFSSSTDGHHSVLRIYLAASLLTLFNLYSRPGSAAGSPWALSTISYSNSLSLTSLDQSEELTYNPQYTMQLQLNPTYRFGQIGLLSVNLSLLQELTNSDVTTRRRELQATDTTVAFRSRPWAFGASGLSAVAGLSAALPTSPWSQAQTMIAAFAGNASLRWAPGSWLFLGYQFNLQRRLYRYTTGAIESPRVSECAFSEEGCAAFLSSGVRNPAWVSTHVLFAASNPLPWLSLGASVAWITSHLYPTAESEEVSFTPQESSDERGFTSYGLEVAAQPHSTFEVAIQANTFNPQLRPGGGYYPPFFNRFTAFALQLRYRPANTLSRTEALQQN